MTINPKYERREGEDQYEYGLRLISTKIEQKPDDLDWEDIVESLGLDCHRDSLRKAASVTPYSGYAVMQYFMKKENENADRLGDDYLGVVEAKTAELRKEAQKFYDQRRELNKLLSKEGRSEHLEEALIEAASKLNQELPLVIPTNERMTGGKNEAVLFLADWHYGMVANNIWEQYDTNICRQRVIRLVAKVQERLKLHDVRKLHIVLLGDMAHGAIHVSARVASEELVCEQIMHVSEMLAQAITVLAGTVEETVIHATYGNHLRTIQNKNDSIHADNTERLIPWWLKQRLGDCEYIKFPDAEYYEFLYFDVCGKKVCATHGDLDSVSNAGKMLNTLFNKQYGTGIDYAVLADKHHQEEFEELHIESYVARSLCGTDEYANGKRLYSTPGQLLMIFTPEEGRDACYQIGVAQ